MRVLFLFTIATYNFAQIDTLPTYSAKYIENDYIEYSNLFEKDCVIYLNDSTTFTGTTYKIEHKENYWFIKNDKYYPNTLLKIWRFENGLKKGHASVINIDSELVEDEYIFTTSFNEQIDQSVKEEKYLFTFSDFRVEYYDVSASIFFEDWKFYSIKDKTPIDIVNPYEIFQELLVEEFTKNDKNKFIEIILESKYANGEVWGHYETDLESYTRLFNPKYCAKRKVIKSIKRIE